MIRGTLAILILIQLSFLTGCQKGVPEIANLRSVPGFSLDQRSISVSNKINPVFSLTGKCNSNFNSIEVSIDGGSLWMPLSKISTSLSVDCAGAGTFSSNLSFSTVALDLNKWSASGSYNFLYLRGVSDLGYSDLMPVELMNLKGSLGSFTPAGANTPLTGGAYKLSGEVSSFSTSPAMSGGNYKLQGEVLW